MARSASCQTRPLTALVLGAGGIKTVCHVGLIRVLQREHIPIDLVIGSSGGSLFGAAFAMGVEAGEIEKWIHRYWRRDILRDWSYAQVLRAVIPARGGVEEGVGIIRGDALRAVLSRFFGHLTFGATQIPLQIVATDLLTGEAVALRHGLLVDAIRASISIPFFIKPCRVDGRLLVDGALTAPLPLECAVAAGSQVVIWMGFGSHLRKRIGPPFGFIRRLAKIQQAQLYRAALACCARVPGVSMVSMEVQMDEELGLCDVAAIPRLIKLGEMVAEAHLTELEQALQQFALQRSRFVAAGVAGSWRTGPGARLS